jgi:hypothetical protein
MIQLLRYSIATAAMLFMASIVSAQIIINSRILSGSEKNGISSAHIFIKNSKKGTYSDSKGYFKLQCNEHDTVMVTCLGFQPVSFVASDAARNTTIEMNEEPIRVKEIIVHAESIYELLLRCRDSSTAHIPKTFQGTCLRHDSLLLDGKIVRSLVSEICFKSNKNKSGEIDTDYWLKYSKPFYRETVKKEPRIYTPNRIPFNSIVNPLGSLSLGITTGKKEFLKAGFFILFESEDSIIIKVSIDKPSNLKVTEGKFTISKKTWTLTNAEFNGYFNDNPLKWLNLYIHRTNIKLTFERWNGYLFLKKYSNVWTISVRNDEEKQPLGVFRCNGYYPF